MFRYDRLDELIKETGKKKNYLSIKMGYSSGRYLNDAKKQNTNIKGDELQILADELNTTPEYLTGETDDKTKKAAPLAGSDLNPKYFDLTPGNRALIDQMIDQLSKAQSAD